MKVNPIAIMDFILTWEGVGSDVKRRRREEGREEGKRKEEEKKGRGRGREGDDADGTLCT